MQNLQPVVERLRAFCVSGIMDADSSHREIPKLHKIAKQAVAAWKNMFKDVEYPWKALYDLHPIIMASSKIPKFYEGDLMMCGHAEMVHNPALEDIRTAISYYFPGRPASNIVEGASSLLLTEFGKEVDYDKLMEHARNLYKHEEELECPEKSPLCAYGHYLEAMLSSQIISTLPQASMPLDASRFMALADEADRIIANLRYIE